MCQFGFKDPVSGLPYRKSTRVIGRLPNLGSLAKKCDGSHDHQHVENSIMVEGEIGKAVKNCR